MINEIPETLCKDQIVDIHVENVACAEALGYSGYKNALAVVEQTPLKATSRVTIIQHEDTSAIGQTIDVANEDLHVSFFPERYEKLEKEKLHLLVCKKLNRVYFTSDKGMIPKMEKEIKRHAVDYPVPRFNVTSVDSSRNSYSKDMFFIKAEDEFPHLVDIQLD